MVGSCGIKFVSLGEVMAAEVGTFELEAEEGGEVWICKPQMRGEDRVGCGEVGIATLEIEGAVLRTERCKLELGVS